MIYLDNAATTFPKPLCVCEEINKCIKQYCGNPGRSSHRLSIKSAEKIYETRDLLSKLFNGEPENVIFTLNTTYALNFAIKSLIKPSSHILISDIEHNSVLRPVNKLSNEKICSYDVFNTSGSDDEIIEDILSKIKNNTSMIVCTHVSNIGAKILPIKKIGKLCKEKGIIFIVDAAQSAGIYEINIKDMNINALCFPAHKGLYGPQGVGAVIFNSVEPVRTIIEGGTGINSKDLDMPSFLPEMLEGGTLPTPSIAGWCEALKWLKTLNINKIRAHEEELYDICKNILSENKRLKLYLWDKSCGNTILFNVSNMSASSVASELDKYDICVRSGFHCAPMAHQKLKTGENGAVRISFSVFNSKKDVYELCDKIKSITK